MNYENVTTRTVKDMLRDPICPEDFGVPEQHAKAAQNYANYMLAQVTAERDALRADAERQKEAADFEAHVLRQDILFLRNQRDELQLILDKRPALNAGLVDAYAKWTSLIYTNDWLTAIDEARGKGREK